MKFLADNALLIELAAALLLVVLLLALVVSAALRGSGARAGDTLRLLAAKSLRLSFRKAVRLIEKHLATRAERYNLSWTLVLNEGSNGALPLLESGLPSALSADSSAAVSTQGVAWNFFDKGVVIQLRADRLSAAADVAASGKDAWDHLLGLCRAYRPQRPFDAIVLALPCALLLEADPEARLALTARAQAIHRRLWLAQNRLAIRFPIHVVVTGCERVPGFASFGAALPEPMRRSILGWASPYELVTPFRIQWVDAAMDQIVGAVADGCAELCALEPADTDSSAYFLLPGELERLRAGLKAFCEELMRPSAYHESFLLRGIYLSGDCSTGAVLPAGAIVPDPDPDPDTQAPHERMPVFLRDIFERKIFPEAGLVRASRQRLRRTAGNHVLYWAGLALPVVWGIGLVVAAFQLHATQGMLLAYLYSLGNPAQAGRPVSDPAQVQRRAAAALDSFEPLGEARFDSVFMPGSWPVFDDLHERLEARLEQDFAAAAVTALSDAARTRARFLTGLPPDAAGGPLPNDGQCRLQAAWKEAVAPASPGRLNLESQPEYGAVTRYVRRLDELGQALAAMQRLAQPGPPAASGPDLALAVRVLLKKELRGDPRRTAALFRAAASAMPLPTVAEIQPAARCWLHLAGAELYQRMFDANELMRTERAVSDSARRLRDSALRRDDFGTQLQSWQQLRDALAEEQALLAAGQGAWMRERTFGAGDAQSGLQKLVAASPLLGAAAAQDMQNLAERGFALFLPRWNDTLGAPDPVDGSTGLAWNGSAWAFTPERTALHTAVTALMAQPYMKAVPALRLPGVPAGASVQWDRAQVERAASQAEARKAFLAGLYPTLPTVLQQPAGVLVDMALAQAARTALAQGLGVTPAQLPSAASDAERASLLRILAWLQEIGARAAAAELDAALSSDALARLARLNQVFDAAQVYEPRDAMFQYWQGQKGIMLDAFGGGDAAGLAAYLEQQQDFVDTALQQAEGVLTLLASSAEARQPLVLRWQALATDQRRYRLKSPTSSRIALENFITVASAEIDMTNCIDRLAVRRTPVRASDPFAERLQSLRNGMLARCRELVNGDDRRQWQLFAEAYNRDLARRLPFVMQPDGSAGAQRDGVPADRDTVGTVLKMYDRAHDAGALAARDSGQPGPRTEVRKADQQLRRVRDLLAPLYPAEEGQAGGLDVAVDFRANAGAETGANKIIDWRLTVGSATLRLGEPARALHWEPGMPVQLSLRLARDGTVVPKAEAGRPDMQVADRTVVFRADDPWALISFVNAYRDGGTPGDDGQAPLLRFEFPLASAGSAVPLPRAEARARVFLRLRVSAPGKHAPLAWPALFPAYMPPWQESQKAPL